MAVLLEVEPDRGLTVADLIRWLSEFPADWKVFVDASDGDFRDVEKIRQAVLCGDPARPLNAVVLEFAD